MSFVIIRPGGSHDEPLTTVLASPCAHKHFVGTNFTNSGALYEQPSPISLVSHLFFLLISIASPLNNPHSISLRDPFDSTHEKLIAEGFAFSIGSDGRSLHYVKTK